VHPAPDMVDPAATAPATQLGQHSCHEAEPIPADHDELHRAIAYAPQAHSRARECKAAAKNYLIRHFLIPFSPRTMFSDHRGRGLR